VHDTIATICGLFKGHCVVCMKNKPPACGGLTYLLILHLTDQETNDFYKNTNFLEMEAERVRGMLGRKCKCIYVRVTTTVLHCFLVYIYQPHFKLGIVKG
jgi:hypothetical protein